MSNLESGPPPADLFSTSPEARARMTRLAPHLPVILIDDFYADPREVRRRALGLAYAPTTVLYPGRIAEIPAGNESLTRVLAAILEVVNGQYLPRVRVVAPGGQRVERFSRVATDFAIVDLPPDELEPDQRRPHIDPVLLFGLVYLNEEERGGTLFYERKADEPIAAVDGRYPDDSAPGYRLCGRIEGRFNRLAIYPGFVPHSGEIKGDWITGGGRVEAPRLTQRFQFFE